jgi:hypothetical protein
MLDRAVFVVLLFPLVGCASPLPATAPASPGALPPEVKKTVDAFAGTWLFKGTFTLSGSAPEGTTENLVCTKTALGRGVYCHDVSPGAFEESQLIAYDKRSGRVRFMIVASNGEVSDRVCRWTDDRTLACEPYAAGTGADQMLDTVTMTLDGNRGRYHSTGTLGGKAFDFDAVGERTLP